MATSPVLNAATTATHALVYRPINAIALWETETSQRPTETLRETRKIQRKRTNFPTTQQKTNAIAAWILPSGVAATPTAAQKATNATAK